MEKLSFAKTFCLVLVLCMATAIASPAQTLTTLYRFCSLTNCADGVEPAAGLVQAPDGSLYGTTHFGGANQYYGTVFKISTSGTLTTLHSFSGSDGASPYAGLAQGSDGNFYGTTIYGGSNLYGTIFKVTPSGALTTLYTFCSLANCTDGQIPYGGLVQATDGNFYGTTEYGGDSSHCPSNGDQVGCGTVFKITPSGILTTLHAFEFTDGSYPYDGLVQAADGSFYGTTEYGGTNGGDCPAGTGAGCGTIFKISPAGMLTTLYDFCNQPDCADGDQPFAGLVQAIDGNFYGTTFFGDNFTSYGTLFKVTPGGGLTTLHSYQYSDGSFPIAGLIQTTDGNFYGTTSAGGTHSVGTIFKLTPSGVMTTLYTFTGGADGSTPEATLMQDTDGNLYGTTYFGGISGSCNSNGCGTVFKLSLGLRPFVKTQPTSGAAGMPVTILGTNLSGATNVTFNGTPATFNVVSSSEITTTVPAGATTGTVQVTTSAGTLSSNLIFQVTGPLQLVPVTPCRVVDTRPSHHPITGGTSQTFVVPQLGNCGIPSSAAAYSLNVTVIPRGSLGYLTVWPGGEVQPYVSTMNSPDGRVKANAAIVPAGNQAVSVYASDTTDVILDINGYFAAPGSNTDQFYPLRPCRLVDTRGGHNGGTLQPGVERDYTIAGHCNVPATATAYSYNVTVIPTRGELDYLTVWPKSDSRPTVSTLNDPTGTVVANAAIVPAGLHNATAFYAHDNPTDLLLDVNGYYAPAGTGGLSLYPTAPCRVLDTRSVGNGQPFQGVYNSPNGIDVRTSACAPPSSSKAFVFNATVVPPGSLPYLTLWPHGESQPNVSTLNATDGAVTSNMAVVPTNDGSINAYAAALTQLILDISGYFAP